MIATSVVLPVLNGARYLGEVLEAVTREEPDEVLVIDSGSRDGSVAIARAAGVDLLEIPRESFGHGRTRNLAAERARGELICFLTQDATPCPGWLASYRRALELDARVGAAYGPHLPRPDTSPMIARELEDFFSGFATGASGEVVLQREETYLSNVNACYRRECWEQIRFRDAPYSEDQAFGRDMLAAGWIKAYVPDARVLHAHDYRWAAFMRRYFDEYRGLRETIGHVERIGVRSTAHDVGVLVAADRRWLRQHGASTAEMREWTARAAAHHAGRKIASALGSRADRLPGRVRGALSLERRDHAIEAPAHVGMPPTRPIEASRRPHPYGPVAEALRTGPAPLLAPLSRQSDGAPLHIAFLIPPFSKGSGGHSIIFKIQLRLERMGHTCSTWLADPIGERWEWPAVLRHQIREWFAPVQAPFVKGFEAWYGADVVIATGWQTVHQALLLPNARARVYLVNDHEPEFFPTSFERWVAEDTYRHGLHCLTGSPWLRALVTDRYGLSADEFTYGVDEVYVPQPVRRRRDTVLVYAREVTPRRAVPLATLAIQELARRRPGLRFVLFGSRQPVRCPVPYEHLGIASPAELAWAYSEATVGLCLSMTNFSLIPKEMLACGLPCVELAGVSAESIFGPDGGPLELAPFDPVAIADRIERLVDDEDHWRRRAEAGREFVRGHTWERAASEVEAGIRRALRERAAAAEPLGTTRA
jgi:glycosyltransferase involved in cell wall biosynthesis/GT2 family glycosyltransferase